MVWTRVSRMVWPTVWTMVWPKVCSVWPLILTTVWRMVWPTVWARVWRRVCSVWPLGWTTVWRMVWPTVWTMIWPGSVPAGHWSGQRSGRWSGQRSRLRSVRSAQWSGQCLVSLPNGVQSLLGLANSYIWVLSVWPLPVLGMVGLANTCFGSRTSSWEVYFMKYYAYFQMIAPTVSFAPWAFRARSLQYEQRLIRGNFSQFFILTIP